MNRDLNQQQRSGRTISLSLGKLRGLQCCADEAGVMNILALDHRGVLTKALRVPSAISISTWSRSPKRAFWMFR